MKKHLSRVAVTAVTLIIGALLSLDCGQSSKAEAARRRLLRPRAGRRSMEMAGVEAPKAAKVQRFGSVIGLKPEKKDYYVKLHANTWPGVLERIKKSNIRNYSIYLAELEGKLYLFSYFEYVGDDFQGDMKKIADDPETQRWWKETDPCQIRLPGTPEGEQWLKIPEVFHAD